MMKSLSQIKKALRLNFVADLPAEDSAPAFEGSSISSFVQPAGGKARGKGAKDGIKASSTPNENNNDDGGNAGGPDPVVERCLEILKKSPNGAKLVEFAEQKGIKFIADPQINVYGYYSPTENVIAINPRGPEGQLVATLAHEMRHAWQDGQGFLDARMSRSPHDVIFLTRLVEADAEANSVQICYELKQAGYPAAFDSHKKTGYGDESMSYEMMAEADPASVTDGRAMRAVFDQWFSRNWRRDAYDKSTTDWLEFALQYYKGLNKNGFKPLTEKYINKLGELPAGGTNYLKNTGDGRKVTDDYYRGGMAQDTQRRLDHIASYFKNTPPKADDQQPPVASRKQGKPGANTRDAARPVMTWPTLQAAAPALASTVSSINNLFSGRKTEQAPARTR